MTGEGTVGRFKCIQKALYCQVCLEKLRYTAFFVMFQSTIIQLLILV